MEMPSETTLMSDQMTTAPQRAKRGFAAMLPEQQRAIASLGGRAAHASGHAHEFNSEEARVAGRKRHEKASSGLPAR
jgi:general stress protein YciG